MRLRATSPEGTQTFVGQFPTAIVGFITCNQLKKPTFGLESDSCRVAVTSRFPQCSVYFRKLPSADGTNDLKVMNSRKQPVSSQEGRGDIRSCQVDKISSSDPFYSDIFYVFKLLQDFLPQLYLPKARFQCKELDLACILPNRKSSAQMDVVLDLK